MTQSHPQFDYDAVFEVDDHMYFYSDALTDERSDAEVAGLAKIASLDAPMRILDIPCGFGRHTNRLAVLGHQMTGMDLYPGFLELARRDAEARGVQVDYLQGDMRHLEFESEFDRVMMLFTSFGYFEDDDNFRVLENVARALKPDGLFILDISNRDMAMKTFTSAQVTEKNGDLMIDRGSFDTLTGRWLNRRIVIRNGVRKDKPFFVRLFNPSEIRDWLARAGMEIIQMYGSFDGSPLTSESRRLIVVSRRVANDSLNNKG
jgi:2-polyprenyl-3-methyl-5-hydroxy-6-metoxy-1,4-benzoquinol methylase